MRPIVSPLEFLFLWSFWERDREKEGGGVEEPLEILKARGQVLGEDGLTLRMGRDPLRGPRSPISQPTSTPVGQAPSLLSVGRDDTRSRAPRRAGGKAAHWPPRLPLTWADGSPAMETVN